MTETLIPLNLTSIFKPFVKNAFQIASRLHAEQKAGKIHFSPDSLDSNLNQTLDRLRGGKIEDSWWRTALNRVSHQYITPEFLNKPALQEWLSDESVVTDLRILAKEIVMNGSSNDSESRARLAQSYSMRTGEDSQLANGPINIVLSILVAGFLASIPSDQIPFVSLMLEIANQMHERFDYLEQPYSSKIPDSIAQSAHTREAKQVLFNILSLRVFDPVRSRKAICDLYERVTIGDLTATEIHTKIEVLSWTAKLCVDSSETIQLAERIRSELLQIVPEYDLSIIDALFAGAKGNDDLALRILRDRDDDESRTVMFGVLIRTQGESNALEWYLDHNSTDDANFFTAVGWKNWAVCMSKLGNWTKVSQQLLGLEPLWNKLPALAYVEGTINVALLIPDDFRSFVLDNVPMYYGITPKHGTKAKHYHARATTCFEFVERNIQDFADQKLSKMISDWLLWLRLMDPNAKNSEIVRAEIREDMDDGVDAVKLIHFAYVFNIAYESSHLKRHLEQRKQFGGLDDDEILAEILLCIDSLGPRELVGYLERYKTRLLEVITPAFLTTLCFDALVKDGQTERARTLLQEQSIDLDTAHLKRLEIIIDAAEGEDPREDLELQYRQTKKLVDLRNLISHLKEVSDPVTFRPLILDHFMLHPSVENALDVVMCLGGSPFFDHNSILDFLTTNSDILEQSEDLKAVKSWALFMAGRIYDSKKINDHLLIERNHQEDLLHKIKISISLGNWEQISSIFNSVWNDRNSYDAETLMKFAKLTSQQNQEINRALEIVRLAVEKAPDNPRILADAYWLHFQLGRDDQADSSWIKRALDISSPEDGPIWSTNLQDLTTRWIPDRRKFVNDIEQKWLSGELPMRFVVDRLNNSLTRLLLYVPDQNSIELDGRRRMLLPIVAGGKLSVELQKSWTIGLDITSILVLFHLDLLETAFEVFDHIKLAPDVMETLFHERQAVQFHQPYLIMQAKKTKALLNLGQIQTADNLTAPPKAIADEVGLELSELLQSAKLNNGKVICALPIYKIGSLMKELADTNMYSDLILSTIDICKLLHDEGKIDATDFDRANRLLTNQGQTKYANLATSILESPIYIDRLALSYLQETKILKQFAVNCNNLKIHPNVFAEINALVGEDDLGERLVEKIERMRDILRNATESEKASFLPYTTNQSKELQVNDYCFQGTRMLLEGAHVCDAISIDDRSINRYSVNTSLDKDSVPIVCVLDILYHMALQQKLSTEEHWAKRHKLRQGGFSFISLESNELLHWLKAVNVSDSHVAESVELRVIRQTIARISSHNSTNATEALELTSNITNTCRKVIFELWTSTNSTPEQAKTLSNWVWSHLATTNLLGRLHFDISAYSNWIQLVLTQRIGGVLLPKNFQSQDLRSQYTEWIEQTVLKTLQIANSNVIKQALKSVCDAISSLQDYSDIYGSLFLAHLPDSTHKLLTAQEPEFVNQCKFKPIPILRIGTDINLDRKELFNAAKKVFDTKKSKIVRDTTGKELSINLNKEKDNITLNWSNSNGKSFKSEIHELALLSPIRKTRRNAFKKILDQLGPTGTNFHNLREEIESSDLEDQKLSEIMNEVVNGVAALQTELVHKLTNNLPFSLADIIPQSVTYFEEFCGPKPIEQDSELYVKNVLIPYRKELLDRNLRAGLDICCLGAIHDDLLPGQWLSNYEDDTIWEALNSCHTIYNPFSLVSALDIALYRQNDQRFQRLSEDVITHLLGMQTVKSNDHDAYEFLQILADTTFNLINLVESIPNRPGYWKRICAWMQAGFVTRTLTNTFPSAKFEDLEEWLLSNITVAGVYSEYIASRQEPMLLADKLTPHALQYQIFVRLNSLKVRHESEGRRVPQSKEIDNLLVRFQHNKKILTLKTLGPLEGHKRPKISMPKKFIEYFNNSQQNQVQTLPLLSLMKASQFFAISKSDLEYARNTVKSMTGDIDDIDPLNILLNLELASIIAATNRDVKLANNIADVVNCVCTKACQDGWISRILRVLIQSAAANETHDSWFSWLEDRLATIATRLPASPIESIQIFLDHLNELEKVLPIESWFHSRAKSIALSGI